MDDLMSGAAALARVSISRVLWDDLWPEAKPLMLAHKAETGLDDPRQALAPDTQAIRAYEATGGLLLLSARSAGALVGYSIWYISKSLETSGLLVANQGPWYVTPAWRGRGAGLLLWRKAKQLLREAEVRLIFAHFPAAGAGSELGDFFAREGGKVIGTEVAIWLDDLGPR